MSQSGKANKFFPQMFALLAIVASVVNVATVEAKCSAKPSSRHLSPALFDGLLNWKSLDDYCSVSCGATASLANSGCHHCLCDEDDEEFLFVHPSAISLNSRQNWEKQRQRRLTTGNYRRKLETFAACGSVEAAIVADISGQNGERYFTLSANKLFRAKMDVVSLGSSESLDGCQLTVRRTAEKEIPKTVSVAGIKEHRPAEAKRTATLPFFVKLTDEPTSQSFAILAQAAGSPHRVNYVPNSGKMYEIALTKTAAAELQKNHHVEFIMRKPTMFKVSPSLLSLMESSEVADLPSFEIKLNILSNKHRDELARELNAEVGQLFGVDNLIHMEGFSAYAKPLRNALSYARLVTYLASSDSVLSLEPVARLSRGPNVDLQPVQAIIDGEYKQVVQNVGETILSAHNTKRKLDADSKAVIGADVLKSMFNLTGSNVTAMCSDSGVYMYHDQFLTEGKPPPYDVYDPKMRKVVMYITKLSKNGVDEADPAMNEGRCGHGTHVCGILAGSSATGQNADLGIASGAKLVIQDLGRTNDKKEVVLVSVSAKDIFQTSYDLGVRVFSLSWGAYAQSYDAKAAEFDKYLSENPDAIAVTAAGNDGDGKTIGLKSNCNGGITMSPGIAKNVITVGSSMNGRAAFGPQSCPYYDKFNVAPKSSFGPAPDGRTKPDILCPGFTIESAQSLSEQNATNKVVTSKTCRNQGTSQAAPHCAGAVVLLYQWLVEGRYATGLPNSSIAMRNPPSSLLKALLIHSGQPMMKYISPQARTCSELVALSPDTAYGDRIQGYGRVDLLQVVRKENKVFFIPNGNGDSSSLIDNGETLSFPFTLECDMAFKAVLVWTDPMASFNAGDGCESILVNDLDLLIVEESTQATYYPVGSVNQPDRRNNVEVVLVRKLAQGAQCPEGGRKLVVKVTGSSLKAGPQNFSLVASAVMDVYNLTTVAVADDDSSHPQPFWKPWMTYICLGAGAAFVLIGAIMLGYNAARKKKLKEEALRQAVQRASVMGRISLNPRPSTARSSIGGGRRSSFSQRPSISGSRNSTPGGRVSYNAGRVSSLTGLPVTGTVGAAVPGGGEHTPGRMRLGSYGGRVTVSGPLALGGIQGAGGPGRASSYNPRTSPGQAHTGRSSRRQSVPGVETDHRSSNNLKTFNTANSFGYDFNIMEDQPWDGRDSRTSTDTPQQS